MILLFYEFFSPLLTNLSETKHLEPKVHILGSYRTKCKGTMWLELETTFSTLSFYRSSNILSYEVQFMPHF
jgi:hypothetical protein